MKINEYSEAHAINWEDNLTQILNIPASMAIFSYNLIVFENTTIFTTIILIYSEVDFFSTNSIVNASASACTTNSGYGKGL